MNLVDLTDYYLLILLPVLLVEFILGLSVMFTRPKNYVSPPAGGDPGEVTGEQKGGSRGKNRRR
jgi:hypothetical protein